MTPQLIKTSARIFGGAAIAGMGLSLGRDVYRGTTKKDTKNAIIAMIILALAVVGTYTAGVLLTRNYNTVWTMIYKRIVAIGILVPSFMFLSFMTMVIAGAMIESESRPDPVPVTKGNPTYIRLQSNESTNPDISLEWEGGIPSMNMSNTNGGDGWEPGTRVQGNEWIFTQNKFYSVSLDFDRDIFKETGFDGDWLPEVRGSWITLQSDEPENKIPDEVLAQQRAIAEKELNDAKIANSNKAMNIAMILPSCVFLIGLISGLVQRKKRKLVWEAEQANAQFMQQNGLVEHVDSTIEDMSDGQSYRIENIGIRKITLFPIGRRSKRAYINVGPDGKYIDFTGMQQV